jgi:hypothetical protein
VTNNSGTGTDNSKDYILVSSSFVIAQINGIIKGKGEVVGYSPNSMPSPISITTFDSREASGRP